MNSIKKYKIRLFILFITIPGCMTTQKMNEIMASWKGSHFSELVATWGPPDQILDAGQGNRIITWRQMRSCTFPGQSITQYTTSPKVIGSNYDYGYTGTGHTTYMPTQTYTRTNTRTFWIDPNGIIYHWAWKGL